MERASVAAEKASAAAEKAMEEFEKLSVQTAADLPKTLAEMEAAGEEWDELGEELRVLLKRVERWGQFSGAEEALTKLTTSVLEEPTRVIETSFDEAESYIKRLSDDFSQAVNQLSGWERELKASVEQAAFSEAWETKSEETSQLTSQAASSGKMTTNNDNDNNNKTKKKVVPSDYNVDLSQESPSIEPSDVPAFEKLSDLADVAAARRRVASQQREVIADAIAVAEAATEKARVASLALLRDGAGGAGGVGATAKKKNAAMVRAVGSQADSVTSALRNALQAVEQAKEVAADASFDSWDEDDYQSASEEEKRAREARRITGMGKQSDFGEQGGKRRARKPSAIAEIRKATSTGEGD